MIPPSPFEFASRGCLSVLVAFASIAHGADVPLFPAFERRWYPGAISFDLSDSGSPQSWTVLVVHRSTQSLSSDSQFTFALQQFTPVLLTLMPIVALSSSASYVY